jgi:hypothetical protein
MTGVCSAIGNSKQERQTMSVLTPPSSQWLVSAAMLGTLAILASGCGRNAASDDNRAPLAGKVSFDGKPLPGGSITFVSTEDARYMVTTRIGSQGEFSVANAPQGTVRVMVETEFLLFGNPGAYVKVPERYTRSETSGLTAKVERGQNPPVSFDLRSQ